MEPIYQNQSPYNRVDVLVFILEFQLAESGEQVFEAYHAKNLLGSSFSEVEGLLEVRARSLPP